MNNKTFMLSAITVAVLSGSAVAAPSPELNINYKDAAGVGVNDLTKLDLSTGQSVLAGEERKRIIEKAVRSISLQFEYDVTSSWDVSFESVDGFEGMTFGPGFVTHNKERVSDPLNLLEHGRSYPNIFYSNVSNYTTLDASIGSTKLTPSTNYLDPLNDDYSKLNYIVLHELFHVMGFSSLECLGDCFPEKSSTPTPMSSMLRYENDGEFKNYETLTMAEKEVAGMSGDKLLFAGSQSTYVEASQRLVAGQTEGMPQMFADPVNGKWSGQVGAHFTQDAEPAQLMSQHGADTVDAGLAAFVMCDLGWCREEGRVTELSISTFVNESEETDNTVSFDVVLTNGRFQPVYDVFAQIRIPDEMTLVSISDNDASCTKTSDTVIDCSTYLEGNEDLYLTVTLEKVPEKTYTLNGEIYSKGYNVDTNGYDNILDTTFYLDIDDVEPPVDPVDPTPVDPVDPTPVDPVDPTPVDPVDPTPVDPVDPTPVDPVDPTPVDPVDPTPEEPKVSESSGGSMSFLGLLPLLLVAVRRKRSIAKI